MRIHNRFLYTIPSALIVLVVLLFSACTYNSAERKTVSKLAGTWKLDSVFGTDNQYHKVDSNDIDLMVFDKDQNFERNLWKPDSARVIDSGKYTVVIMPQRGIASISLIPNLKVKAKDTIRNYYNFDVVKLTDSLLYKVDATELREQSNNQSAVVSSKRSVYKLLPVKVIK
ncbi:hypothetical protein [Mucilaginibacter agri]|uniref:Uncharacterized protein n=1 Tax=Mucilaginibacter agri TaxID=2695265 RepID=A0A965ZKL4_9SPHI|nr:hypothetical protein [Mucilaginibacter agri]NCD71361.1 hypothetical protein [Mucilaginibacter agri]